jgi:hypothetical protein
MGRHLRTPAGSARARAILMAQCDDAKVLFWAAAKHAHEKKRLYEQACDGGAAHIAGDLAAQSVPPNVFKLDLEGLKRQRNARREIGDQNMKKKLKLRREAILNLSDLQEVRGGAVGGGGAAASQIICPQTLDPTLCGALSRSVPCETQGSCTLASCTQLQC